MSIAVFTSFLQLCDNAGDPLNGGSVTVYQDATTTPIQLYYDDDLAGGHETTNPITLDAYGRHAMTYFTAQAYKVVVKDSVGSTIFTRDVIDPGVPIATGVLPITGGGTGASDAATALSNLGGATAAELAALAAELTTLAGTLASSEKTHIATGTTAQRPAGPIEGDFRRNTTTSLYEGYNGSAWENFATYTAATACPTIQVLFVGSGTYTKAAGVKYLHVRMVGGGGGGGAQATNAGAAGSDSSFGTWTAIHGNGGAAVRGAAGIGGTGGVDGTGRLVVRINGGGGAVGGGPASNGGTGGNSAFGGGGPGAVSDGSGIAAAANSGAGGGAGGSGAANSGGSGGGAGEYVEFYVQAPAATYSYTAGARGAGGAAGTKAGGDGGDGIIIVEEFYT